MIAIRSIKIIDNMLFLSIFTYAIYLFNLCKLGYLLNEERIKRIRNKINNFNNNKFNERQRRSKQLLMLIKQIILKENAKNHKNKEKKYTYI